MELIFQMRAKLKKVKNLIEKKIIKIDLFKKMKRKYINFKKLKIENRRG